MRETAMFYLVISLARFALLIWHAFWLDATSLVEKMTTQCLVSFLPAVHTALS